MIFLEYFALCTHSHTDIQDASEGVLERWSADKWNRLFNLDTAPSSLS